MFACTNYDPDGSTCNDGVECSAGDTCSSGTCDDGTIDESLAEGNCQGGVDDDCDGLTDCDDPDCGTCGNAVIEGPCEECEDNADCIVPGFPTCSGCLCVP